MGGAPSKPGPPETKFQVIGAGIGRTGTVSMQLAFQKLLDGPCLHGGTHTMEREDAFTRRYIEAYNARRVGDHERVLKLIREQTKGFVGCTDQPNLDFLPEMLELYPDVKVVLVTRDPQKWWKSAEALLKNANLWFLPYLMWIFPTWRWFPSILEENRKTLARLLNGQSPGPHLIEMHNQWVRGLVPKEHLLEFQLDQGWEPLCKFLDRPVPDEQFPRANDGEATDRYAKMVVQKLFFVWSGIFLALGSSMYFAVKWWTMSKH